MLCRSTLAILLLFTLKEVLATLPACTSCPADGIWSNWVDRTSCSASCGLFGKKVQARSCSSWTYGCPCTGVFSRVIPCGPNPCANGSPCAAGYEKYMSTTLKKYVCGNVSARADDYKAPTCTISSQLKACPCPPGGLWSLWSSHGGCSSTCGLCGTVFQNRTCRSQSYGCPCTGAATRNYACPATPCPTGNKCCSTYPVVTNSVTKKAQCGLQLTPDPALPLPNCKCTKCTASSPPLTIDTTTDGTKPFDSVVLGTNAQGCVTKTFTCTSTVAGFQSVISLDRDASGTKTGTPTATAVLTCNAAGNGWFLGTSIETIGCFGVTCANNPSLCP